MRSSTALNTSHNRSWYSRQVRTPLHPQPTPVSTGYLQGRAVFRGCKQPPCSAWRPPNARGHSSKTRINSAHTKRCWVGSG